MNARLAVLPLLLLVLSCTTASSSDKIAVTISQMTEPDLLRASPGTAVPVEYRIDITNSSERTIALRSIEIESVGEAGGYLLRRARHSFERTIPARSTSAVDLRAWIYPLQIDRSWRINAPVVLRGNARFDTGGKGLTVHFKERVR